MDRRRGIGRTLRDGRGFGLFDLLAMSGVILEDDDIADVIS
jgi:hypothetical protein